MSGFIASSHHDGRHHAKIGLSSRHDRMHCVRVKSRSESFYFLPFFSKFLYFSILYLKSFFFTILQLCSILKKNSFLLFVISLISSEITRKNHVMMIVLTTPNLLCYLSSNSSGITSKHF